MNINKLNELIKLKGYSKKEEKMNIHTNEEKIILEKILAEIKNGNDYVDVDNIMLENVSFGNGIHARYWHSDTATICFRKDIIDEVEKKNNKNEKNLCRCFIIYTIIMTYYITKFFLSCI
ncbi:MAG: hypothetical protein ACRC5M_01370 [Anaeroplasmataceae bacterium]